MKKDLDALMQARGIDALLVTGPALHNPSMYYFTGPAHVTNGDLIKKVGCDPVLFFYPMERDEAAAAAARQGLQIKNLGEYNFTELLKQAGDDFTAATIQRYKLMLQDQGIVSGKIAIYGRADAGAVFAIFQGLQNALPKLTIAGETNDSLIMEVRATKDPDEVERIRAMGKLTTEVVSRTADLLSSSRVKDEALVKADGSPLTVGDVKRQINLWLAELGAENPENTIFAIGRDAGVPHSSGNPNDLLRLGKTIVFDIFPCESGGGYFYDFTRTWCLGYAPDDVQALYQDVYDIYRQVMSELEPGRVWADYQKRTCDLFEARGHPTIQSDPRTESGYVHSLGHGLGLDIHERLARGFDAAAKPSLVPGTVVTVEPGLYYPERGMGVRLEDTIYMQPDGSIEILAPYPLDLVLPVKG